MKSVKLAIIAVSLVANVGCSTVKGWFNDDAITAQEEKKVVNRNSGLKFPEGINNPVKSKEFAIPPNINQQPDSETVTSPTTVLVILENSWIDGEDPHPAKIKVEKPELVTNFSEFIHQGLAPYGLQNRVQLSKKSDSSYLLSYTTYEESGWWFWKSEKPIEEFQFNMNIDMVQHGRSGQVYIDPVSYKIVNAPDEKLANEATRVVSTAVYLLNQFMLELDYQYRVTVKKEHSELNVTLQIAESASGIPILSSQEDITYVYSQFEDVFEQLGFKIDESDDVLHTFEMSYESEKQSLWDAVFNSDVANKLDIASGEYVAELTTSINGVYVKVTTKEGVALSKQQVQQMFDLIMTIIEEDDLEL